MNKALFQWHIACLEIVSCHMTGTIPTRTMLIAITIMRTIVIAGCFNSRIRGSTKESNIWVIRFCCRVLQLGCGVLSSVCPISFWFSFYINTYQFMRFVPLFVPPFAVFYVAFISLTEQLRPHMLRELDIRAELEARQM